MKSKLVGKHAPNQQSLKSYLLSGFSELLQVIVLFSENFREQNVESNLIKGNFFVIITENLNYDYIWSIPSSSIWSDLKFFSFVLSMMRYHTCSESPTRNLLIGDFQVTNLNFPNFSILPLPGGTTNNVYNFLSLPWELKIVVLFIVGNDLFT